MEYVWMILGAIGAGVGTGLAGLSAATVMVPILIVLCPSFAGETGAYHATAIALASDILGSAFTAGIYIKHKNIDLRRGWIMLVCILSMCIVGSAAAFAAGNVVLGGFSLFLCVGIGIRFLVSPDTKRKDPVARGAGLGWRGVLISLFFGLTIGFGTGFVGTGGGMMMLVVFTAFLGMERKQAVGTSTFIMTFTALIAFISHAMIDPTIVLARWDLLLIGIVTATAASIVSARFANRVNNRVVGLVTGAVLTVLGVAMLLLNYREQLAASELFRRTVRCFGQYLIYIVLFAASLIAAHLLFRIPRDIFRKLLHFPAFTSSIFVTLVCEDWRAAAISLVVFALLVYPILHLVERHWTGYERLFVQKYRGEVKMSLLILFLSQAAMVAIFWGLCDEPFVLIAATAMWGCGDTAAALIGGRLGKHYVHLPLADGKKTWEGSAAMCAVAFGAGLAVLLTLSPLPLWQSLLCAAAGAVLGAYVELISHGGFDTVTVPVSVGFLLLLLSWI